MSLFIIPKRVVPRSKNLKSFFEEGGFGVKYGEEEVGWCSREVRERYGVGVWKAIKGGREVLKGRTNFKVAFRSRVKFLEGQVV
ncbi:hypothetical protein CK203_041231 [Vitis vinifera]|uniref:Uncharacterized protein n=1 Tax=Vitis vinifera TaxID=29760 RepID=A0A438HJ31_VITVI|nr:hypothetical protein CK203_041231 [Vitis vinifera]